LGTFNQPIDAFSLVSTSQQLITGSLTRSIGSIQLNARQPHPIDSSVEFPIGSGNVIHAPPGLQFAQVLTRVISTPAGSFTLPVDSAVYLKNGSIKPISALVAGDVIKTYLVSSSMTFTGLRDVGSSVEVFQNDARVLYLLVTGASEPDFFDLQTSIVPVIGNAPSSDQVCSCALMAQPTADNCGTQYQVVVS
jgi:hypothetical protein